MGFSLTRAGSAIGTALAGLHGRLRHKREVEKGRREVDGPLEVRSDGDCTVIPVLEEVLLVQKRWVLKEEIRIRRRSVERTHEERVLLAQRRSDRRAQAGRRRKTATRVIT